ncbi:MAG: hypothetical protein ACYTG0_25080 [Planctomycetota bacterium]|jgi:hypothetical protein
MNVSNDLLLKAASHRDPAVKALAADIRALEAEDLRGRAFHHRARRLTALDGVLREVCHGGVPLPAAMEQAGLAPLTPSKALGTNPGDAAAVPRARR